MTPNDDLIPPLLEEDFNNQIAAILVLHRRRTLQYTIDKIFEAIDVPDNRSSGNTAFLSDEDGSEKSQRHELEKCIVWDRSSAAGSLIG